MKRTLLFVSLCLLVLSASANADFAHVRSISTPHGTGGLTGLDAAEGALFAVESLEGQGSCMYLIDPATGDILREACLDGEPPGYPGMPLQFVSCTFNPWGDLVEPLGFDAYWVGDATGALIRYKWTDTYGPAHAGHCEPAGLSTPVGLAYRGDLVHILDHGTAAIYELKVCFGQPPVPIYLPDGIADPSALCSYGGNWFVCDPNVDVVYEIDDTGALVATHMLEDFYPRTARGMTFLDHHLFVASDDDEILVYRFADFGHGVNVPEGENIVVTPLPDEIEITFPSVVDSGSLYVYVREADLCLVPEGVRFLPDFYEILTDASFEYIAQIALMTQEPLPPDVDPDRVRIFTRPSGDCETFMDITVAPIELYPEDGRILRRLSRTLSEDDEFSFFVLAEDNRNFVQVANLKYVYLEEAIDAVAGTPVDPMQEMLDLLAASRQAFGNRRYGRAATLADRIAGVALATPEIAHVYHHDQPGTNLGGRIVAQAHTLSFSIRLMVRAEQLGEPSIGGKEPVTTVADASRAGVSVLGTNRSRSSFAMSLLGTGRHPVSVRLYSVRGELVRTLLDEVRLSGPQMLTWDGRDSAGKPVGGGVYFMIVETGEEIITRKLILQR